MICQKPLRVIIMRLFSKCLNSIRKHLLVRKIQQIDYVRLNIGAGGTKYNGWISVEKDLLDITQLSDFDFYFSRKKISKILAEHVVEHVYKSDFINFLYFVRKYLEPMASIRIAVPDAYHPSDYVRELTKPGGLESGADDHRFFYSIDHMREIASSLNYILDPIEYFDKNGVFHSKLNSWDNGYICRSSTEYIGRFTTSPYELFKLHNTIPNDLKAQFVTNNITYTSLIVDFINYVQDN